MRLPRRQSPAFAAARTFANDGDFAGANANAHLGYVGSEVMLLVRPGPNTSCCEGPAIPSIIAKYAVGFGDGVLALDVVQGGAIRLACFDVLGIEFGLQLASLCVRERHHFVLTVRVGLILLS